MTISADCTVQDGAGSPFSPYASGANVTPGNTVTIQLSTTSGVDRWELFVAGTDELISAPTLTINSTTKTATFTAPAAGSAIGLTSRVTSNNGRDPATGRSPYVVARNIGIYTLTSGKRVGFLTETFEGDPTYGYIPKINAMIRAGGGGGSTPTGTGIPHIVAGVQQGASSLIVNADVSGSAAIDGSKLNANLAITTSASIGSTAATTGSLRLANAAGTLVSVRNAANSADIVALANASNALTYGDTTNAAAATFTSGAGDCKLQTSNGTYVQLAYASGNIIVSTADIQISNSLGGGIGLELTPTYNGAAKVQFGALVTSAAVNVADTAVNSATGITTTYGGQNATGTTTIGGDTVVSCGTGTTRYGNVKITGPLAPGRFAQAMADANQTISVANSISNIIETTGALTATRTLTISRAPTNSSMVFINNKCTGGFGLLVQFLTGSTFAIASGKSAIVYGDGTNATGFTITT